jgi:hypothetical protein
MKSDEIDNPSHYFVSINQEFSNLKNRVRNLIGDANWGEEGRYKEKIIINMLKRYLPSKYKIGTGFCIDLNKINTKRTTQLDVIIFEDNNPLLFQEGDFYILTPRSVRGIIEVKTNVLYNDSSKGINDNNLEDIIIKMNKNGRFFANIMGIHTNPFFFNGIFAFDNTLSEAKEKELLDKNLKEKLKIIFQRIEFENPNHFQVGFIVLSPNYYIRHYSNKFVLFYKENNSYTMFLNELIGKITGKEWAKNVWNILVKEQEIIGEFSYKLN